MVYYVGLCVSGSYTADYTTSSDSDGSKKAAKGHGKGGKATGGESVEEKNAREREEQAGGWGQSWGGSGLVGRLVWDALVLLVGVALGACAARAYGGYERRGQYQPIDRA